MAGRFITLEGGEGAGKTTLSEGLAARLSVQGRRVVRTREPGGTLGADQIRALLVTGEADRWSSISEALLFTAARNDHLERVIRPALQRGDWVICDRFVDSTRAYQSAAGGVSPEKLERLNDFIDAPTPDITFVLDVDPRIGLGRARSAGLGEARYESKALAFHERVRAAFLKIAADDSVRCCVVNAADGAAVVLDTAARELAARFGIAS